MKIGNRYVFVLVVVTAIIVLPGCAARLFGASIDLLAPLAAIHMFASLAFFVTSLVSVGFAVSASIKTKWREAAIYLGASALPLFAWGASAFSNGPCWEAVMGI